MFKLNYLFIYAKLYIYVGMYIINNNILCIIPFILFSRSITKVWVCGLNLSSTEIYKKLHNELSIISYTSYTRPIRIRIIRNFFQYNNR